MHTRTRQSCAIRDPYPRSTGRQRNQSYKRACAPTQLIWKTGRSATPLTHWYADYVQRTYVVHHVHAVSVFSYASVSILSYTGAADDKFTKTGRDECIP